MKYTEHGLQISIEELERLLEYAKLTRDYHCGQGCIYIKGGDKPTITQYSVYAECNPTNHTYLAH